MRTLFVQEIRADDTYDRLVEALHEIDEDIAKAVALYYFMGASECDLEVPDDVDLDAVLAVFDDFCSAYDIDLDGKHLTKC